MQQVKSTMGLEIEFMLIDKKGQILDNADAILARAKKINKDAFIIPEIAHNMLELGSTPSTKVSESAASLMENINISVKAASLEKTLLLPMATYPLKFSPSMRDKGLYAIKKKLFMDKFELTGKCVGFHLHHALPEGSFDATSKNLKAKLTSSTKKSLIEAYNLTIALDPVLTTFMQSSPFYEGRHLGKDSRMVVYRGGRFMGYAEGLYSENLQEFGELPEYKLSESDLIDSVIDRYSLWKTKIREIAPEILDLAKYESVLETNWCPVKINPHGTIEIRGMDVNFVSLMFSISAALKYIYQDVYERSLHVVPSDIGIAEYFKEENGKLYVPPDEYVRKKLQYLSAHLGMDNDSVQEYCKSFLKLAKSCMPSNAKKLLIPFEDMVENKHTVSDQIIKKAKKLGYEDDAVLTPEIGHELTINHANNFLDDLEKSQDLLEKNTSV